MQVSFLRSFWRPLFIWFNVIGNNLMKNIKKLLTTVNTWCNIKLSINIKYLMTDASDKNDTKSNMKK